MNGRGIRVYCGASTEERETRVSLTKDTGAFEITQRLRKIEGAAVLGDNEAAWCKKRGGAKEGKYATVFVGGSVRGIEENNVEGNACGSVLRSEALQGPQGVELENSCAPVDA